jgi:hypothetical protein
MRSLVYTKDCKNIFPCRRTAKTAFFQTYCHTKSNVGDIKDHLTLSLWIQKHQQNSTSDFLAAVISVQNFSLQQLQMQIATLASVSRLISPCRIKVTQTTFYALKRLECVEKEKRSKQLRRDPSAASHGDFRRSLYEVTINSMGKPQRIGENA